MNAHSMPDQNRMIVDSAEKAVLGALMLSEHAFWQVNDRLRADHFHRKIHQRIFSAIKDVCEEGRKLSQTIVQSRLGDDAEEDGYSIAAYLAVLMTGAEDIGLSADDFVDQVVDAGERRRLVRIAEGLMKAARDSEKTPIDLAAAAEAELMDVLHVTSPKRPKLISEIVAKVVQKGCHAAEDSSYLPGFDTGLPSLDEILGLIFPGDLGFILGSQGDGKSSLLAQLAAHIAQTRPVLMIQLEMGEEQQAARELAYQAQVQVREIQEGAFDFAQKDALEAARQRIAGLQLYILESEGMTVKEIEVQAQAMQRTIGLGAVLIDQVDKIKVRKAQNKFDRLEQVTADLKRGAKRLGVPFIAAAQRTRTAQRRDSPVPHITDAECQTIERDGDWVLALWRKKNWMENNPPAAKAGQEAWGNYETEMARLDHLIEIISLKNRRRRPFQKRPFHWDGVFTRISEING